MDKLILVLESILSELQKLNKKLDNIKEEGIYNSISDVYDKLDDVENQLENFETTITLGGNTTQLDSLHEC